MTRLYAANLGLSAINSIRETFKESDIIRVHPIITKGGGAVNAIPDDVKIESYVRGKTFDAIKEANDKVNRALCGAALSLGANAEINDMIGYSPLLNCNDMTNIAEEAAKLLGFDFDNHDVIGSGSTDMGDLSCIMPVVHPYAAGAVGRSHGSDYFIENPDLACIGSAQWQLVMMTLLLQNNAERAKQIIADFGPMFASKEEFFEYVNSLCSAGERIAYNDDGTASVRLKNN